MKYILALLVLVLGSRIANAGAITGTSTVFNPEIRQRLNAYEDWAVWNTDSLQANVTSGAAWINYSLVATPYTSPATQLSVNTPAAIFYTGAGYYTGGLSYNTSNVDGKGFTLTVPYGYANDRQLDLWFMTNGPVAADLTASSLDGTTSTVHLDPYNTYVVSFQASGLTEDLTVAMVGSGAFSSAQGGLSFGAAALTPVAVPEPNLNCLFSIVALVSAIYLLATTNCFLPPPPK